MSTQPKTTDPADLVPLRAEIGNRNTPDASNGSAASSTGNRALSQARSAKQDEFYTQLSDIENELKHYRAQLKGKIVLCNCDDPYESNFFRYFALKFNDLGLKKLIATSYAGSNLAGGLLPLMEIEGLKPEGKEPYAIEINEVVDVNNDGAINLADVEWLLRNDKNSCRTLTGDGEYSAGDFRSAESIEYLKEADVVITNPPFSLFRAFVSLMISYQKDFLIIGNLNAIHYSDIFGHFRDNKMWLGESIHSGDREFRVPEHYPLHAAGSRVDEYGNKYIRVKGVRWYTNMDNPNRHEMLPLFRKYDKNIYPKYDNLDAIEVSKTNEIPADYFGLIGVPDSFMDKFNPDQFDLIGIPFGNLGKEIGVTKNYRGRTDIAITQDGRSRSPYSRIIIKRKLCDEN